MKVYVLTDAVARSHHPQPWVRRLLRNLGQRPDRTMPNRGPYRGLAEDEAIPTPGHNVVDAHTYAYARMYTRVRTHTHTRTHARTHTTAYQPASTHQRKLYSAVDNVARKYPVSVPSTTYTSCDQHTYSMLSQ